MGDLPKKISKENIEEKSDNLSKDIQKIENFQPDTKNIPNIKKNIIDSTNSNEPKTIANEISKEISEDNNNPDNTSTKKPRKKILSIIAIIFLSLIIIVFLIRLINPSEIDDVSPSIQCDSKYLEKSDVLWIIPDFNKIPILENKTWCSYILGLNKTLEMHGITHEYDEFETDRTLEYLKNGTQIFKDCFGFSPEGFKPPQLKISENNKKLIRESGLKLRLVWHQITRKVYHCNDSEEQFSNKLIDWI